MRISSQQMRGAENRANVPKTASSVRNAARPSLSAMSRVSTTWRRFLFVSVMAASRNRATGGLGYDALGRKSCAYNSIGGAGDGRGFAYL